MKKDNNNKIILLEIEGPNNNRKIKKIIKVLDKKGFKTRKAMEIIN